MQTYDVIVVGARAAGAATAMLLARQGLRVLVLERDRYGTDTLSTHALMRGSVLMLSQWGLLGPIVEAGTPPVRQTRFHYGADTMTVTIKPTLGVEALYGPRRTVLDAVLVDAAVAAGAEVRFGVTVTGLLRDATDRVVGVTGRDRRAWYNSAWPASPRRATFRAVSRNWPEPSSPGSPPGYRPSWTDGVASPAGPHPRAARATRAEPARPRVRRERLPPAGGRRLGRRVITALWATAGSR